MFALPDFLVLFGEGIPGLLVGLLCALENLGGGTWLGQVFGSLSEGSGRAPGIESGVGGVVERGGNFLESGLVPVEFLPFLEEVFAAFADDADAAVV